MTVREAVRSALGLLTARDRRLLMLSTAIQMGTLFLDLLGVVLIGLSGALAATTVQAEPAPATVTQVADRLGLGDLSDQALMAPFAAAAAVILLTKSIVSFYLTRRVLMLLAKRLALVSSEMPRTARREK